MRTAVIAFALAAAVAAALTPLVRALACRYALFDHALSARKVHGRPIPRLGGVAIVVAFFVPLAGLLFVDSEVGRAFWALKRPAGGLFVGGLAIAALGLWDDLRGANARTKFVVQFAVGALMYACEYRIDAIANPFGEPLELGPFGLPFTMLWIAGIINAMNLIDGLDGLAGGVAFISISTVLVMSAMTNHSLMMLFSATLAGAVLGFLRYNFNPATIFMGDTGSMFLGFVIATTSIRANQKSSSAVAILLPILALGVPVADTLLAMGRRALRGAPLFAADRGHIHHRLLDRGLSHRQAVLVIYAAAGLMAGTALVLTVTSSAQSAAVIVTMVLLAIGALRALGFIDLSKAQSALTDRRQNLDRRAAVRRGAEALRRAKCPSEVWAAVQDVTPALGAAWASLHLSLARWTGGPQAFASDASEEAATLKARYRLDLRPGDEGALELGWADGRTVVDRDTEIAVEQLCEHICAALDRLAPRPGTAPQAPPAELLVRWSGPAAPSRDLDP